jgi:hypothetical protein
MTRGRLSRVQLKLAQYSLKCFFLFPIVSHGALVLKFRRKVARTFAKVLLYVLQKYVATQCLLKLLKTEMPDTD